MCPSGLHLSRTCIHLRVLLAYGPADRHGQPYGGFGVHAPAGWVLQSLGRFWHTPQQIIMDTLREVLAYIVCVWFILPTACKCWEKPAIRKLIRPTAGYPSVRIGLPAQVRLRSMALCICGHNRTKYPLTQLSGPIGKEMVWPQFGPPMLH